MTNFTEIDSIVPLIELEEEDGEPVYVGFIESSLAKMIPKFLKALVTLLICGFLLGLTFLLISLWKRGCRKHTKLEEDTRSTNGNAGAPLHSVVVTPPTDENMGDTRLDPMAQPVKSNMKVPKQSLRRASGPFGSEALSFVGEQYTMKTIEKERHHYAPGHQPRHHPGGHSPVIRSGGSTGRTHSPEQPESTKSKWNCLKGNKE